MSSGPRIAAGAGIYGTGAAPKMGYPNGSDGAAPLATWACFQGRSPTVVFLC